MDHGAGCCYNQAAITRVSKGGCCGRGAASHLRWRPAGACRHAGAAPCWQPDPHGHSERADGGARWGRGHGRRCRRPCSRPPGLPGRGRGLPLRGHTLCHLATDAPPTHGRDHRWSGRRRCQAGVWRQPVLLRAGLRAAHRGPALPGDRPQRAGTGPAGRDAAGGARAGDGPCRHRAGLRLLRPARAGVRHGGSGVSGGPGRPPGPGATRPGHGAPTRSSTTSPPGWWSWGSARRPWGRCGMSQAPRP